MADSRHRKGDAARWKPPSLWAQVAMTLRRRMLLGLITVIPILCVFFVLTFTVNKTFELFESAFMVRSMQLTQQEIDQLGIPPEEQKNYKFFRFHGVPYMIKSTRYYWGGRALAIFVFLCLLYLIGLLSSTYIVRRMIHLGERALDRIPIVKTIYKGTKQLVETISSHPRKNLREVVLVEYPRKDCWVVAYVTGETVFSNTNERMLNLFVPTTPNPTSGFFLLAPEGDVRATSLTMEEAVKYVVSAGIVVPEHMAWAPYAERHSLLRETARIAGKEVKET
ncbi:DUF502 domain-containing protein [Candidatus Sumerlaeota bacterium]|nr:DUF502 domain-containing protein [Candidatus Sumerlaeota bacterium]